MKNQMLIEHVQEGTKGYFKAIRQNTEAGRLTYTWAGEDKFIIDHTEVYPEFSKLGIGKQLVTEAVKFARDKHVKIIPLCPFAHKVFGKTEEIQDVLFH
ncbi:GNAT family N-acetyltransferase [Rapidithrix thailandica]|uniref:GNAT family N-acetyltransferase n=1 Tax=Rapidithrix thailandica TaxID=413964 RepID=A0AAW9RX07_9BACT